MATAATAAAVPDGRSRWIKGAGSTSSPVTTAIFLFFFVVVIGVLVSARWITTTTHLAITNLDQWRTKPAILTTTQTISIPGVPAAPPPPRPTYSISCSAPPLTRDPTIPSNISQTLTLALSPNNTATCASVPDPPPLPATPPPGGNASSCPSYFRFIHEDLHPWRVAGGITRAMVDRARATANFRLVVIRGRAYVERIAPAFQTRDLFTIWGILQLLRRYPGRVPDLDLMFDCVDWPVVHADQYDGENATVLPPLFRYCGDNETLDVVFPDWSFWGCECNENHMQRIIEILEITKCEFESVLLYFDVHKKHKHSIYVCDDRPEINIKPWDALRKELDRGNKKVKWLDREPYAYWKGNPDVAAIRQELVKCNVSSTQEWNARIYKQDWLKEIKAGYKQSDLSSQCTHRVLMPMQHYWPVRDEEKCSSIKYAVDWGNSHKQKARRIGKQASNFIQEELRMDYVYDYMFHLLTEYAKLLRFKPTIPPEAVEVCPESLACQAIGREKKFMEDSMVRSANDAGPCDLPPPFSLEEFEALQRSREKSMKQIEAWEQKASKPVDSKP
ncbi:hypothetical protein EJB05_20589 [Eragrostis curvula]|uniref:Glycosyl transferase CAP10 domain-containing protein n=1 Tax=Eragrostis curvula TaxID=38414 RepID=A0A5J9V105_9POAL|nr:hypothetical protein EJB05_20589 [Eragrostis curvula]